MLCACMRLHVCECVCMREPPARLCTMDVCVELRRSGGSGPDCRNPEVVVAITGRVSYTTHRAAASRAERRGGGRTL